MHLCRNECAGSSMLSIEKWLLENIFREGVEASSSQPVTKGNAVF